MCFSYFNSTVCSYRDPRCTHTTYGGTSHVRWEPCDAIRRAIRSGVPMSTTPSQDPRTGGSLPNCPLRQYRFVEITADRGTALCAACQDFRQFSGGLRPGMQLSYQRPETQRGAAYLAQLVREEAVRHSGTACSWSNNAMCGISYFTSRSCTSKISAGESRNGQNRHDECTICFTVPSMTRSRGRTGRMEGDWTGHVEGVETAW